MRLTKVQKAAIAALEDIKARDITILDSRRLTSSWDCLIIATADSARQTKAIARNVHDKVKAAGGLVLSTEGEEGGEWVVVDCGDTVVHVMQPAHRALYNLEELWTPPEPVKKAPKAPKTPKAAAEPAAKKTAAKKTAAKKAATQKVAAKPAAKKEAAKKPAAKKPAAKPAAKKPAAKKPAAKKATTRRSSSVA